MRRNIDMCWTPLLLMEWLPCPFNTLGTTKLKKKCRSASFLGGSKVVTAVMGYFEDVAGRYRCKWFDSKEWHSNTSMTTHEQTCSHSHPGIIQRSKENCSCETFVFINHVSICMRLLVWTYELMKKGRCLGEVGGWTVKLPNWVVSFTTIRFNRLVPWFIGSSAANIDPHKLWVN